MSHFENSANRLTSKRRQNHMLPSCIFAPYAVLLRCPRLNVMSPETERRNSCSFASRLAKVYMQFTCELPDVCLCCTSIDMRSSSTLFWEQQVVLPATSYESGWDIRVKIETSFHTEWKQFYMRFKEKDLSFRG